MYEIIIKTEYTSETLLNTMAYMVLVKAFGKELSKKLDWVTSQDQAGTFKVYTPEDQVLVLNRLKEAFDFEEFSCQKV